MTAPHSLRTALLSACAALLLPQAGLAADGGIGSLRLIGEQDIAFETIFENTPVGGLSGIDYDAANGIWYLISDDRSAKAPARFYTARLAFDDKAVSPPEFLSVVTLTQPDGAPFPNAQAGGEVPDPESIRLDPKVGVLWWTSEGDRKLGLAPTLREAALDGRSRPALPTPGMFAAHANKDSGTRNNLGFEGLSFSADGESLWVALEAPIYEDGPAPTADAGATTRLTQFDRQGKVLAQYALPLDAIPARPGEGKFADNGVTEILAVGDGRLLAVERAGVQAADDSFATYVRLYEIDLAAATDVSGLPALAGASFAPAAKRLVLNLNELGLPRVDNIEGLSFGPKLANGHDSLVLVSDNNFNKDQITQVLVFEVVP